jgi:hypothetical protein
MAGAAGQAGCVQLDTGEIIPTKNWGIGAFDAENAIAAKGDW